MTQAGGAGDLDAWGGPRRRGRLLRGAWRDLRTQGAGFALRKVADLARLRLQLAKIDWTPRRLSVSLDSIPIDRPIFILGVQGGGITVLARCLYRHPQAVYASGNCRFWAGMDEIHNSRHIRGLPEAMIHRSQVFGNLEGRVADHPVYGLQRAWLYAVDDLLSTFARDAGQASEEEARQLRSVIRRVIRAYALDPRHARFVDMSQLYTIQVPYLCRLLEGTGPRFVLVARNPYATCARAAQKEYVPERGSHVEDPGQRARLAVEHWTNSYRLALAQGGRVPMLVVRYEDFLADPRSVVQEICRFAELDFHEEMVPAAGQKIPIGSMSPEKWYPVRPSENERYLSGIDTRIVALLEERGADVIEALGYERMGCGEEALDSLRRS
jgi:hypothetical protein